MIPDAGMPSDWELLDDELLDEVGPDAARFTLLAQSHDSVINFDIEEVHVRGRDEVAVLASSFNRMRISLAKALRMLEES